VGFKAAGAYFNRLAEAEPRELGILTEPSVLDGLLVARAAHKNSQK
jgi:hypothetical protein